MSAARNGSSLGDATPGATPAVCVVIPTIGRPSLLVTLESLARAEGPRPSRLVVVDDRPPGADRPALDVTLVEGWLRDRLLLVRSGGRGPAAARNVGWRAGATGCEWVAFIDDDVVVGRRWLRDLQTDLLVPGDVAGVQGRIAVPLPGNRRPTDWERATAGLASARWITADMAYRRAVLEDVNGFDERFPRAFREDADIALRVMDAGHRLVLGRRSTEHPVRPARWRASLDQQRGNSDDPLMRRLHGRQWATRAQAPRGRRTRHALITAAGLVSLGGLVGRRRAPAVLGALASAAGIGEFAYARIAPGPRTAGEIARMAATSVLIPPAAVGHWLAGLWRWRRARPWPADRTEEGHDGRGLLPRSVAAVLFDRDGTLVDDVPYNGDPGLVRPAAGAADAVARLRKSGIPSAIVSNQSGIARGMLSPEQVDAVNDRISDLLGPFEAICVCPHQDGDDCECRKPAPGLVLDAAKRLAVAPTECVVIGDIAADVGAARAAGAGAILVPTPQTRAAEVAAAPLVCVSLTGAVDYVLAASGAKTAQQQALPDERVVA